MKNLKTFDDEQPWPDERVVLYSFIPLFDDALELSESRKSTAIRLLGWMLQTLNITPEEFLKQVKADEPLEK